MQSLTANSPSKTKLWVGRILSGLMILFLTMDAVVKFFNPAPVVEASAHLGLPPGETFTLGVILLVCTVFYALPLTSILGAILLTGYLGGAVATHLRIADSLFNTTFPVLLGVALWAGLYLRDTRLQSLIPLNSKPGRQL